MQTFIPKKPDTPSPRSSQTHHRRIIRTRTQFKIDGLTRYNAVLPKNDQSGINDFIDHFVDGQETSLGKGSSITPPAMLQWEIESRNLPPTGLVRFDGDPTKWPEFIQSFKTRVHMKHSFTDFIRMERLISVLDGEPKKFINALGTNGMFYASALKSFKEHFGNPYLMPYLQIKDFIRFTTTFSKRSYWFKILPPTTEKYLDLVAINRLYFCDKINRKRN